jgi:hypothetical protein
MAQAVSARGICGVQSGKATVFLPVLLFSPGSIIATMLHTYLHIYATATRRTNG